MCLLNLRCKYLSFDTLDIQLFPFRCHSNINKLYFNGNDRIKDEDLKNIASLTNIANFNPTAINSFVKEIEKLYFSFGYNNVDISFKGSGRRKFVKFGLAAESIENDISNIINEQYSEFEEQLKVLNEGKVWDTIKSGFDSASSWVKSSYEKIEALILQFYESVIKKVLDYIWELFQKGLSPVLEKMGYIMEGVVSLSIPVW